MQQFVIKERSIGNYCDESSFMANNEQGTEWIFNSCTGLTPRRCLISYSKKERAEEVLKKLQEISKKLNINKEFYIAEVNNISFNGEIFREVIKIN